jgi:hypothetical protein
MNPLETRVDARHDRAMTDAVSLDPSAHAPTPWLEEGHEYEVPPELARRLMPRDPWYRRALRGALAGCAGTALMTPLQFEGAIRSRTHAPPIEITRRLHRALPLTRPRRQELHARGLAMHVAYGALAGALYGIAAPRRGREATALGYAAVMFGVSYFGYLPLFSLHPPAHRDNWNRQLANAGAHAVYGLTLAEGMRVTDPS